VPTEPREQGGEIGREEQRSPAELDRLEFAALDGGVERGATDAEHVESFAHAVRGFHEAERARVGSIGARYGVEAGGRDGGGALAVSFVGHGGECATASREAEWPKCALGYAAVATVRRVRAAHRREAARRKRHSQRTHGSRASGHAGRAADRDGRFPSFPFPACPASSRGGAAFADAVTHLIAIFTKMTAAATVPRAMLISQRYCAEVARAHFVQCRRGKKECCDQSTRILPDRPCAVPLL
jgi:hypothetical protein